MKSLTIKYYKSYFVILMKRLDSMNPNSLCTEVNSNHKQNRSYHSDIKISHLSHCQHCLHLVEHYRHPEKFQELAEALQYC
jgi:hypothetical protein